MTTPQDPFAVPDPGTTRPAATPPEATSYPPAPYGQPTPYGEAPPYGVAAAAPRNGFGTAALICGILAVVGAITIIGGILFGTLAAVFGALGRGRVKRREATNGGSATAGLVLGVLGLLLSAGLIAFGVSLLNSDNGKQLQDCLSNAGTDRSAQEKCRGEFQDNFRY